MGFFLEVLLPLYNVVDAFFNRPSMFFEICFFLWQNCGKLQRTDSCAKLCSSSQALSRLRGVLSSTCCRFACALALVHEPATMSVFMFLVLDCSRLALHSNHHQGSGSFHQDVMSRCRVSPSQLYCPTSRHTAVILGTGLRLKQVVHIICVRTMYHRALWPVTFFVG